MYDSIENYEEKTLQTIVMSASILSSILVVSVILDWQGNSMQIAPIAEAKKSRQGTSNGETQPKHWVQQRQRQQHNPPPLLTQFNCL